MVDLTNRDLGDLIDALGNAAAFMTMQIAGEIPVDKSVWDDTDSANYADWSGRLRRYRALRRRLLKEEKSR